MKKMSKGLLMTALICGSVMTQNGWVYAAEAVDSYVLDPLVVTAQRMETKDLDTPAMVEVYDEARIAKSGAANAFDVLQNTLGVNLHSQGFNGAGMGTMTSRIMIRGVEKGTLVLVNGVPMNLDGKYNLEDIPTESIERIEVVKGGGSVLYGSEATGGVINIITKAKMTNSIKVAAGNFGKEKYSLSLGGEGFNVVAGLENRGFAKDLSSPASGKTTNYDYGKGERRSVLWNAKIAEGLTFTHSYSTNEHEYRQNDAGVRSQNSFYENEDNNFLLQYDMNGWKATAAYGTQEKVNKQNKFSKGKWSDISLYSSRKGHGTNLDVQKAIDLGEDKLIVGTTYQREDMDAFAAASAGKMGKPGTPAMDSNFVRDNYSIYASYDWKINEKNNLIINARETWASGCEGSQENLDTHAVTTTKNSNMNKFTPELEYVHKLSEDSSLYAKAGKSFRMPTLTQIFGTGNINPSVDLAPESGTHYEVGYKQIGEKDALKIAVFNYEIKDAIEADVTWSGNSISSVSYFNEDTKNTGIEISYTMNHDDHVSTTWGAMYQSPKAKNTQNYGDQSWHDVYNKYQLQGAVNYQKDKFTSSLSANFIGDRTSTKSSSSAKVREIKPQLFTDLHFAYAPEQNHKLYLHINNILDRKDIMTNSSTNYYNLGRNFMLGYEYSF